MSTNRRLIIDINHGPNAPLQAEFDAPCSLTVGRHSTCGLVLREDSTLSRRHFRIDFDGLNAFVHDLGSTSGIRLDGIPIESALLPGDSVLTAGATRFEVRIVAAEPAPDTESAWLEAQRSDGPRAVEEIDSETQGETLVNGDLPDWVVGVEGCLRSFGQNIFAVMDAARDAAVIGLLGIHAPDEHVSLLPSKTATKWSAYGPFLVELTHRPVLFRLLLTYGWGKSWGIYCVSDLTFPEMASHLRSLIIVEGPEGQKMIFRYYDPRVLADLVSLDDQSIRNSLFSREYHVVLESEPGTTATARVLSRHENRLIYPRNNSGARS
jgi:hypothetical protein